MQEDHDKFKTSLGYNVMSRLAWAREWQMVTKGLKKKKKGEGGGEENLTGLKYVTYGRIDKIQIVFKNHSVWAEERVVGCQ